MIKYRVVDKKGNTLLESISKDKCLSCASHHKGSRVFSVKASSHKPIHPATKAYALKHGLKLTPGSVNTLKLKRNPDAYFEEEDDSYKIRIDRFSQYASTDSEVWMRETIQNAVDNKSTDVKISVLNITSGENRGCHLVRIIDNGTGMTSEILRNKFLKKKGSDKPIEGNDEGFTIGGFGEAKLVILLAWKAWRVITKRKDYNSATIAESLKGGRPYFYDEIAAPPELPVSGTIVEILTWPNSEHTVYLPDAVNFVAKCNLPKVKFSFVSGDLNAGPYCNGFARSSNHDAIMRDVFTIGRTASPVSGIEIDSRQLDKTAGFSLGNSRQSIDAVVGDKDRGIPMENKECAKLYAKKSEDSYGYIYYRSKGLLMWKDYLSSTPVDVIVEFTVSSLLILTNNRDGIKHKKLAEAIREWVTKITKDPSHALRGFSKTRTIHCKGTLGAISAPIKPQAKRAVEEIMAIKSGGKHSGAKEAEKIDAVVDDVVGTIIKMNEREEPDSPVIINGDVAREFIKYEIEHGIKNQHNPLAVQEAIERLVVIPEYLCHIEEDLFNKEYKIPKKFEANNLTIDVKKLLAVWVEMIRVIFMLKGSGRKFGVGFCFSEEALGMFVPVGMIPVGVLRNSDADGFLLVNPFYDNLKTRDHIIDISKPAALKAIWSTAIHECTHMIDRVGQHDTAFASYLTVNAGVTAGVYGLIQEISKIVTTTDTLEKSKFSASLDIDSYLDDSVKKPRSSKEKNMEKYVVDLARELVNAGLRLPPPDSYGVSLPDKFHADIEAAKQNASAGAQAADVISKQVIKTLRAKVLANEARIAELEATESKNNRIDFDDVHVEAKPKKLKLDMKKITKKYN